MCWSGDLVDTIGTPMQYVLVWGPGRHDWYSYAMCWSGALVYMIVLVWGPGRHDQYSYAICVGLGTWSNASTSLLQRELQEIRVAFESEGVMDAIVKKLQLSRARRVSELHMQWWALYERRAMCRCALYGSRTVCRCALLYGSRTVEVCTIWK